ncbi:pyrroline-5-carboxylate reductase family protein [Allorhizobium terrae]|uniref:Pyrroline-5-carboxylate reductase n=1 Tax=Allorhizobium terrae TaxID=1848972 RepID=A0A4S3ZQF1_9HYPH|nr:pyrroline-5-carboxylate reductase [Allorhizobium terrae]THF47797.1 pyrroline-5-carboxylate reductase [Allorhizobium terrae]
MMERVGIIGGAGWLGNAFARALVLKGIVPVERLLLSYRSSPADLPAGANWTPDNQQLVDESDIVLLSVRPEDFGALKINAAGKLIISVMAGITLARISAHLGTDRVVRALPNAGAEVLKSYTPWIASEKVNYDDRAHVKIILAACGDAPELSDEVHVDYFTGLTGSGPAFPALLMAAMEEDAVRQGIDPAIANEAVCSLLIGMGRLWETRAQKPEDVVKTFLSYRGTTAAAIEAMRTTGFDRAVSEGLQAAFQKSVWLGRQS